MFCVRRDSLPVRRIGRQVWEFDRIDSTSTLALLLDGSVAHEGLVITAREQLAGRGRPGRRWFALPDRSALLSVLLFPPPTLRRPALLTAFAAVAAVATIEESTGLAASIKWPNDILIGGKKVCGILVEQGWGVVIGIGVNLTGTADEYTAAGLAAAGSLAMFAPAIPQRRQFVERLICRMDQEYDRLLSGDERALLAAWQNGLGLVGASVQATTAAGNWAGILRCLDFDQAVLETASGPLHLATETLISLSATEQ